MRDQLIHILRSKGLTYHTRESWEPDEVARDRNLNRQPPLQKITDVTREAVHYTAAINLPDGDPGEILDGVDGIRRLLIRTNWDYLRNRTNGGYRSLVTDEWFPGYPLGYNWAYDWLGGIWEINGFEFRPAATSQHNSYTKAHLLLTDRADPASELMQRSVRELRRAIGKLGARSENRPWAHGWFKEITGSGTVTPCCGDANKALISQGRLDLSYEEGEKMLGLVQRPEHVPPRIVDTRSPDNAYKLQANKEATIAVPGAEGATMAVVNIVSTQSEANGFLTAWAGGPRPTESKINFAAGQTIANEVTIALDAVGAFKIWSSAKTHVVIDLVGYHKPIG